MDNSAKPETKSFNNQGQAKLCPFMSRPEGDRLCEGSKCMAWGEWTRHGAYRDEIEITGCYLIKSGE